MFSLDNPSWGWQQGNDIILRISVQSSASKTLFLKFRPSSLLFSIKAPPEGGKANAQLLLYLSTLFEKNLLDIQLLHGHQSPKKLVFIKNIQVEMVEKVLRTLI